MVHALVQQLSLDKQLNSGLKPPRCFRYAWPTDNRVTPPATPVVSFAERIGMTIPGEIGGLYNVLHFGSAHKAGIQGVYADGSVHTITYEVEPAVFNSLASRAGAESIEMFGVN